MGIVIVILHRRNRWVQMCAILIEIPVFAPRDVWVVRVCETDGQAPRPIILTPAQIVNLAGGVIGDLIVIFHLIGNLGHPGPGDRPKVVIPPVDPLAGFAIIRGPAEIGGVNIGRQALFEAVQLIGADEMHLAGQAGLIPGPPQVVGIGGDIGAEFGGIVINPTARRQKPRHKAGPPRRTKRAGGISIGKSGRTIR